MRVAVACCALVLGTAMACAATAKSQVPPQPYQVKPGSTDSACASGAAAYAQVYLTNAGLFDQNKFDKGKTKVLLLAKKPVHRGMWESVYFMTLYQNDGKSVSIITVSTNTEDECSVEDIKTYVVSHQLGHLPEQADLLNSPGQPAHRPLSTTTATEN